MNRGRVTKSVSFYFLVTALCFIPLLFSKPTLLHADDFIPEDPTAEPAKMAYQPSAEAESFTDLMAVDTVLNPINAAISYPEQLPEQVSITATIPVTATTVTTLNSERDNAISINNDQVGVVIESGTLTQTAALEFTLLAVAPPDAAAPITPTLPVDFPTGQGVRLYETPQTYLAFQVEAVDTLSGEPITTFNKQVRLAIDVRDQGYEFPEHGMFFLAYRSTADPNEWIDVPLTVYEPGFYSAEVDHFSDWTTGWRPDGWTLTWNPPSADGFTGASTYAYPFQLPPGRNGLQPNLALSYSDSALNGATRRVSAGTVAAGWSLNQIAIVRTGVKMGGVSWLDLPNEFRLVLNGTGYKLTATSETLNGGTRYTADSGPQLLILKYGSSPNEYWIVINGDGTHYRLGYTTASRTSHHLILNEHLAHDEDPNSHPTYDEGIIEWHVDTVTDTSGNQVLYEYDNSVTTDYDSFLTDCFFPPNPPGFCAIQLFTKASRLTDIYYNFWTRIGNQVGSLPPAHNVPRLNPIDAATRIQLVYNEDGGRFSNLLVYHKSSSPIREYQINSAGYSYQNPGCPVKTGVPRVTSTYTVQSITEYGWNSATGVRYALPTTQFGYVGRRNYTASGDQACFVYHHLKWMTNGYGGRIEFDYTHDNRSIGEYTYNGSGPLTYPDLGFNHYVTALRQMDGRGNTSLVTYARHGICYNQTLWEAGTPCPSSDDAPDYGVLAGFNRVEAFYWKLNGTTLERIEETHYHTSQALYGRPWQQNVKDSSHDVRQRTETTYHTGMGEFHPVAQVITTWYVDGLASTSLSNKITYEYDPSYQGSSTIQYGNLTHIREYADANASTPYRITRRWYKPNISITTNTNQWHWLVSFLEKEAVYSSENGAALTIQYLHYDGLGLGAVPTKGLVTRVRQGDPNTPCGGEPNCSYARKTVETSYTYDAFGNLLTTTTYSGYGYQSFNSNHAPLPETPPTGPRTTTLVYDADYKLYPVQVTDPAGYVTKFDIYGFKNGNNTVVSLDGFSRQSGLLKQVTGANGLLTLYEYDPFGRLTNVYDAVGDRGTANQPWDGNPLTRYQYFDNDWQGNKQIDPTGNKPFPIVVLNRPQTYHTGIGGTGYELKQVTYYDGLGRPIQSQERWAQVDGVTNRQDRIVTTAYDAWGRAICATIPYTVDTYTIRTGGVGSGFLTSSCASLEHTWSAYDDIGRVTAQYNSNDALTAQYEYGITTHITVDGYTRLQRTMLTDANNHRTNQFQNSVGQLVLVREITGDGSQNFPYTKYADTRYRYDLFNNLIRVGTTAGLDAQPADNSPEWKRVTTMSYDAYGRKTGMTDADMGTWGYSYDGAGNLTRQQDAKGQVLCFFYDNLNRLTSKRQDNPVNGCSSSDGLLASYTYFGPSSGSSAGQVQEVRWSNVNNRDTFSYNSKGLLATHTRLIDGNSYTLTYGAYDLLNRPTSVTYPNSEVVTMTYDREGENGLTISSSPYTPAGTLVDLVSYNEQGQLVRLERGNGVDTAYSYYEFPLSGDYQYDSGRLRTIQHGGSHDPLPDFKYFYDNVGNIDKIETFATPPNNSTLYLDTQTFSYDEQNRLVTANGTGQTALSIAAYQEIYDHDLLGNLIQLGPQGQTTLQYNDPAHKHAATHRNSSSTPSYTYDPNGNMTSRVEGSTTYTQLYDAENRLVSVMAGGVSTTFAYDDTGQRVKTTENFSSTSRTVTYYPFPNYEEEHQQTWQPGVCLATCPGSWVTAVTVQRSLYGLAGQTIATRVVSTPAQSSDGLFYFLGDHLGSTRLLTTASGTVAPGTTAHFLPFGTYRGAAPSSPLTDRGFTGHKHDDPLGLVYMNARFYLPSTGRFLTADTIVPNPSNPQDYNRYSYVLNNPIMLIDPSGHFSEGAIWGHIYDNVCYSDMECTVNTLNTWKEDTEWWDMLLAAQAGDVIITSNGNYVFRGEGKYVLTGISFGYSDGSYSDWAPSDIYSPTLNDLFNKKDGREWVGLIQYKDDGTLSDILLRLSTITEAYKVIDIPEAGAGGTITQVVAFGLCSLATGSLSGGSACSRAVASTIRLGKFVGNPRGLEQGDQVYKTPAGTFVYRGTDFSDLNEGSGQPAIVLQMQVYYYGGLFFVPELMATCNWNESGYICN